MSLSALAATVAPTNAAAAKNVIECFMVLTPRVHQLSGGQRPVQHQCSLQGPAPTGTEQLSKRYFQDRVPFGSTQIRGC
ncbi:MAG: hypothetical protein WBX77_02375, partial [Pseudolabrys sp.]|jgi:hypothetical protein